MKKALILLWMTLIVPVCFSQWSISLNTGLIDIRRDIPEAGLDNLVKLGLRVDLKYAPDSSIIVFNLSSFLIGSSRSETFTSYTHYASDFFSPVIIMGGAGVNNQLGEFIVVQTSLQLGYWYTHSNHYYNYSLLANENQFQNFERKFSQFALGPKINIDFGKKRLKGTLTFENYFLTSPPGTLKNTFGRERFTSLTIGLSYNFGNKKMNTHNK